MKRAIWVIVISSFLAGAASVQASERRSDRARHDKRDRPAILLASASGPAAAAYVDAPPPAPAVEGTVSPTPYTVRMVPEPGPAGPGASPAPASPGIPLFQCVKYHDRHNIAPCAVPMCVAVADPCACKDRCSCCAPPKCVMVEICVPPCGCPKVTSSRDGTRVRYDYGKYAVDIKSRNGVVRVDYDD